MPLEKRTRAGQLIEEFELTLESIVRTGNVPRRLIRPLAIGSVICGLSSDTYFVGYFPQLGVPTIIFTQLQGTGRLTAMAFHSFLADRTAQDFAVVELQDTWLSLPPRGVQSLELWRPSRERRFCRCSYMWQCLMSHNNLVDILLGESAYARSGRHIPFDGLSQGREAIDRLPPRADVTPASAAALPALSPPPRRAPRTVPARCWTSPCRSPGIGAAMPAEPSRHRSRRPPAGSAAT